MDDIIRFMAVGEFVEARNMLKERFNTVTQQHHAHAARSSIRSPTSPVAGDNIGDTPLPPAVIGDILRLFETWYVCAADSAVAGQQASGKEKEKGGGGASFLSLQAGGQGASFLSRQILLSLSNVVSPGEYTRWEALMNMMERLPRVWRRCMSDGEGSPASHLFTSDWVRECSLWEDARRFRSLFDRAGKTHLFDQAAAVDMLSQMPCAVVDCMLQIAKCIEHLAVHPNPVAAGVAQARLQQKLTSYAECCDAICGGIGTWREGGAQSASSRSPSRGNSAPNSRGALLTQGYSSGQPCAFIMAVDKILQGLLRTSQVLFSSDIVSFPQAESCSYSPLPSHSRVGSSQGGSRLNTTSSAGANYLHEGPAATQREEPSPKGMGFLTTLFSKKSSSIAATPTPSFLSEGPKTANISSHSSASPPTMSVYALETCAPAGASTVLIHKALGELSKVLGKDHVVGMIVRVNCLADVHPIRCWERSQFSCSLDASPLREGDSDEGLSGYVWCSWYPQRLDDGTHRTLLASAAWRIAEMVRAGKIRGEDWDGDGRIIYCFSPEECPVAHAPFIMVARSDTNEACDSMAPMRMGYDSASPDHSFAGDTPRSTFSARSTATARAELDKMRKIRDAAALKLIAERGGTVRGALGDLYRALMLSWSPRYLTFVDQ